MKKRQALKILKICNYPFISEKTALGQRSKKASRYRYKQIYRDIKRQLKIEFSKPHWKNISICKNSDYQVSDVKRELIAFGDVMENEASAFWED